MKKIISFCVVIAMVLSLSVSAFAVNTNNSITLFGYVQNISEKNQLSIADEESQTAAKISLDMSDVSNIWLSIESNFVDKKEVGTFYVYDEGRLNGTRVVGAFPMGNLRIDKDSETLTATIDGLEVVAAVNENQFAQIYDVALQSKMAMIDEGNYDRNDYIAKMVYADIGFSYTDDPVSSEVSSDMSSADISSLESRAYTKPTFANLKNFLRALSNNPNDWISIRSYGITEDYLTTEEYVVYYGSNGNNMYFCAKKTDKLNGYYYSRLGILDLTFDSYYINSQRKEFSLDAQVNNGLMLEYDASTGKARLYVDNWCPIFYNIQPTLALTSGDKTNIFVTSELSGSVKRTNVDVLTLISTLPEYGWIATLFSALKIVETNEWEFATGVRKYKTSMWDQIDTYGGAIREMSYNSQKAYVCDVGNHVLMTVMELYNSTAGEVKYAWRTSAALNVESM
ncbi:hypothetical protein AALA54_00430 [Oscillospiraceae bacterium 44-34]